MRRFNPHELPAIRQKEVSAIFSRVPAGIRADIERSYKRRLLSNYYDSIVEIQENISDLVDGRINYAASDYELREFAKARADECFRIASRYPIKAVALLHMREVAQRYEIQPPNVTENGVCNVTFTVNGEYARLTCAKWWRRAVRRYVGRRIEGAAVTLGLVHRRAGLYASNETVRRRTLQKKKNRQLLESIIAVNEAQPEGLRNEYTLAELSDLGMSNPELRRKELMTRLAGFDALAKEKDHAAEFYTLTAPGAYHARQSGSGEVNPKYNGSTPRETQRYLGGVWSKIRAKLHRMNIRIYGFRVCEPHHDGTPHWHMVLFMQQQHVKTVREIMAFYALQVDGKEPGATKHRFTYKAIDRSKGNAAGYLAKYISKNIDGYNVGEDYEGAADSVDSAKRVDAWASCWGIRQFQQIGGAPVTVWRELRRMDAEAETDIFMKAIITAADAGNWTAYTQLQGGGFASRADYVVTSYRVGGVDVDTGEITFNAYGEIASPILKGVTYQGEGITTRAGVWVFKRGGAAVTPWSSVNNCTGSVNFLTEIDAPTAKPLPVIFEKTEFFTGEKLEKWQKGEKDEVENKKRFAPPLECARVLGSEQLKRGNA